MKGWTRVVPGLALLGLLAVSCATSTEMSGVWKDPSYVPTPVSKVMIIGIGENELRVKNFEDQFGQKFTARKLAVVTGTSVVPRDTIARSEFVRLVKETGSNLLITVRLVGMDKETSYVPGTTYMGGYGGYGGYYYGSYAMVHDPGYVVQYKVYKVETNVYDVATEKMIWNGLSNTTDPANAQDAINSLGDRVVYELSHAKIIP